MMGFSEGHKHRSAHATRGSLYLLCAITMAYGWGWRGSYGHEAGAMLAGALLGMAVCLGVPRKDWQRRSMVAAMAGAIGWAWGGTLTNMEHRLYIVSDTYIDAAYGFFGIGLVGLLWSGIGGAILALAFTRSRSELNRFIGPLTVIGIAYMLTFLYFSLFPDHRTAYEIYTQNHWHDGEWLAALTVLVVLAPYWLLRKADRSATQLILLCAVAWWVFYLALTKFGGLKLAPPYRSEVWAGVIGIFVALIYHHWRNNDRAALLITGYAALAGCLGFILALQFHVMVLAEWGPFTNLGAWKYAEEIFGLFMGLGIAMAAARLYRGELAPASEDTDRMPLDRFAAFVAVVVVLWMNLKHNPVEWAHRYGVMPDAPFATFKPPFPQLPGWVYFFLAGGLWTALALFVLRRYKQGRLLLFCRTPYEKGVAVFFVLLGISLAGELALRAPSYDRANTLHADFTLQVMAALAVWILFARAEHWNDAPAPENAAVTASDPAWKLGLRYWLLWIWVPIHIFIAAAIAVAMTDGFLIKERHRFGPNATWRIEEQRQAEEAVD